MTPPRGTRVYVEGVGWVRSKYEAACVAWLRSQGVRFSYEVSRLAYELPKVYIPDFDLTLEDGRLIHIEAKGHFDQEARTKMLAVKAAHPQRDIRMLFMKDKILRKGAKMTYAGWAEKHGFPYAIGPALPTSWIEDVKKESDTDE